MKILSFKFTGSFFILLSVLCIVTVNAQDDWPNQDSKDSSSFGGADPFGGDPFGGMIDSTSKIPPIQSSTPKTAPGRPSTFGYTSPSSQTGKSTEPVNKAELPFSGAASREAPTVSNEPSSFQNAIIEGIQIVSEKGEISDEKIVTCYFIFRDKPTSYFYDVKVREKKLIFEFNDTRTGSSPVPTTSELPIKGFTIESGKVDVNKEVRGLMPEWHDLIKVTFDLEEVPRIHVSDEYSIISFSFKWSSNPQKIKQYSVQDNSRKVMILSTAGVGGAALGALGYFIFKPKPEPNVDKPIPIEDLPSRSSSK